MDLKNALQRLLLQQAIHQVAEGLDQVLSAIAEHPSEDTGESIRGAAELIFAMEGQIKDNLITRYNAHMAEDYAAHVQEQVKARYPAAERPAVYLSILGKNIRHHQASVESGDPEETEKGMFRIASVTVDLVPLIAQALRDEAEITA